MDQAKTSIPCWQLHARVSHEVGMLLQEFPMFHTMDGRKVVENLEEFDDAREVRVLSALPFCDSMHVRLMVPTKAPR